jgi:hypothetical protein
LKWPPADVKSGGVQVPTVWMWKPWNPGGTSFTRANTVTLSSRQP